MNFLGNLLVNHITHFAPHKLISKILRMAGFDINNAVIRRNCYFDSERVKIGNATFVNQFCQFHTGKSGEITIGENCDIGTGVTFLCVTHEIGPEHRRAGESLIKPIHVGDGVWIGSNVTILPGVDIGNGCIIAAGSVVTKSCASHGLYGGVPARRIKDLN